MRTEKIEILYFYLAHIRYQIYLIFLYAFSAQRYKRGGKWVRTSGVSSYLSVFVILTSHRGRHSWEGRGCGGVQ